MKVETKSRWSSGGQFYFTEGEAYGITKSGHTYYAGTEDEITKSLENNTSSRNPNVAQSLEDEKYMQGHPTMGLSHRQLVIQANKVKRQGLGG